MAGRYQRAARSGIPIPLDTPFDGAYGGREEHQRGNPMTETHELRAYLIFTGTGPILALSTYSSIVDPRLVEKLRLKGIDKFIAYDVDLAAVEKRYHHSFANIVADLAATEDLRVLDFNGHQIMANFSLDELGTPTKFSG
jgi:hypothetical protein